MSDVYGYSSELSMGNSVNSNINALNRNIRAQNVQNREKFQNRIKGLTQTYNNTNPTLDKVKEGAEATADGFYALGGAQIINFSSEDLFVKGGETHNGTTYTTDYSLSGNKASDIGGHLGIGVAKIFNDHFKFFMENKITFNPFLKDLTTFSNLSRNQFIPTIGLGYQF